MNKTSIPFFEALLQGDKAKSQELALAYFEQQEGNLMPVYEDLIKEALYEIGRYWEFNKISVATEHLASAISEAVLNQLFARVSVGTPQAHTAVFTCVENEQHEIGIKMVNDIFELHQWQCYYLGANTPIPELLNFLDKVQPDVLAISLSMYFNLPKLKQTLTTIKEQFPKLNILVGGQAFTHGGKEVLIDFPNVQFVGDLEQLEQYLNQYK